MAILKRKPLNAPFIKLNKKMPMVRGKLLRTYPKSCLDVDMQTGEVRTDEQGNELRKDVNVLVFESLGGCPIPEGHDFQMFQTGGLKANHDLILSEGLKGIEIEWTGKTELDDGKKSVNEYLIYPIAETPIVGLTSAKPVKAETQVKHA